MAVAKTIVAQLGHGPSGPLGMLENALNESAAQVLLAGFTDLPVPSDPEQRRLSLALSEDSMLSDALDQALFARVDHLVTEGILDGTDSYRVQDPLKPAVHQALNVIMGNGAPSPGPPSNTRYTVKVALKHTKPPVWRRLELDGALTLGDLHEVIQESFDWDGSHMHEFSLGPAYSGGLVYVPSDQMDARGLSWGEAVSEESITLAAVLPHVGDRMTYLYDFGDDWIHEVRVEAIAEKATTARSPVSTNHQS